MVPALIAVSLIGVFVVGSLFFESWVEATWRSYKAECPRTKTMHVIGVNRDAATGAFKSVGKCEKFGKCRPTCDNACIKEFLLKTS